tara:strand:- start:82 stop:543 length:462 start_codon:yes stop_codon:yes gene_type:complete
MGKGLAAIVLGISLSMGISEAVYGYGNKEVIEQDKRSIRTVSGVIERIFDLEVGFYSSGGISGVFHYSLYEIDNGRDIHSFIMPSRQPFDEGDNVTFHYRFLLDNKISFQVLVNKGMVKDSLNTRTYYTQLGIIEAEGVILADDKLYNSLFEQ